MRLIDADALVEAVKDYPYGYRGMIVCDIANQPTIDPVRHGRWEVAGNTTHYYTCSVCGKPGDGWDNYCRSCGAKMDEERKDDEL